MAVDIAKITVWVPDLDALNQVLAVAKVHTECGSPRRDADGSFIVTLYATAAEANKVAALGFRHKIDKKYGDALEERQKQVSKTDRFEGGKIKPVGLGEKR